MIELSVENLHLTYGDNPVLKGVSMTLGRGGSIAAGAFGKRENHAAAGGGRAGKPTSGRIAIGNRTVYDGTPRSEIPAEERNLGPGVPVLCPVAAQNGVRQCGLSAEAA